MTTSKDDLDIVNEFKKGENMDKDYFAVIVANPMESIALQRIAFEHGYKWNNYFPNQDFYKVTLKTLFFFPKEKRISSGWLTYSSDTGKLYYYGIDDTAILNEFKKEEAHELGIAIKGEKLKIIKRGDKFTLKAGCSKEYDIEDFYLLYNWLNDHEKVTNTFNRIFIKYKLTDSEWKIFNLSFFDNNNKIDISREKIEEIKKQIDKYLNK